MELAKKGGRYVGRKPNTQVHQRIIALKGNGYSIADTARLSGFSFSQVKRVWAQHLASTGERQNSENKAR
ncbi:helix-turn-helix domain-containing protein [Pseudomonas synxantha]|nr:helix-turn-helix domain-containing protein [Pseudomonas synxantha]